MLGFLLWSAAVLFLIFVLRVNFYGQAREAAALDPRVQRLCNWIMCAEVRNTGGKPVLHIHPPMQADRLMLIWPAWDNKHRVSILVQESPLLEFTPLDAHFTAVEHHVLAEAVASKIKHAGFAGSLQQRQSHAYNTLFPDLESLKET